uniref:Putative secreted protein n=1 Tax=Lutzomyia longipalpis TaxID=7200 RepID=A0A1B0GHW8_LUTLO
MVPSQIAAIAVILVIGAPSTTFTDPIPSSIKGVDKIECYKCFSVMDPECFDDTRFDEFRVDYCPEKGMEKNYPEEKYECFKLTFFNPRYEKNHVFRGCAPIGTDDFLRREEVNCTILEYSTCTENFCNGLIDNSSSSNSVK